MPELYARVPSDIADIIHGAQALAASGTAEAASVRARFSNALDEGVDVAAKSQKWQPEHPHAAALKTVRLDVTDATAANIKERMAFFRLSRRQLLVAAVEHSQRRGRKGNLFAVVGCGQVSPQPAPTDAVA